MMNSYEESHIKPYTGKLPCWKTGRMVHYWSLLERDYFVLLDLMPNVINFAEQPTSINYTLNGFRKSYTPDAWIKFSHGESFQEVKPADFLAHPDISAILQAASEEFTFLGQQFSVVTDDFIRQQPRLDNCKFIHGYHNFRFSKDELKKILHYTTDVGESVTILGQHLEENGFGKVLSMVCRGYLTLDHKIPFSKNTILKQAESGNS